MQQRIDEYRKTGGRAVEFQLRYLQPDGGYIWDGYADDAFHKQAYSWAMAGRFGEANRLLNWVKADMLQEDGQLRNYKGDVYKHSWFFQGAHRLGRFDLSFPVWSFLASTQTACGGFPHFAGDDLVRSMATAWAGVSAIYLGEMDVAKRAAECAVSMLEQQPDEARFYFCLTPEGKLVTGAEAAGLFIDSGEPSQTYWEVGLPMMLMCRMYMASGEKTYLDAAEKFFEFKLRCHEDNYSCVGSGKSALAAALYYLLTDDDRARGAATEFCEFLVETQYPNGGWRGGSEPDRLLIYIDHAAEYNVWLQEISAILESRL